MICDSQLHLVAVSRPGCVFRILFHAEHQTPHTSTSAKPAPNPARILNQKFPHSRFDPANSHPHELHSVKPEAKNMVQDQDELPKPNAPQMDLFADF